MVDGSAGPPDRVTYEVDEALQLPAVLEDGRDVLTDSGDSTVVIDVEEEVRDLSSRSGFHKGEGGNGCPLTHSERPRPPVASACRRRLCSA